MLWVPSQQKESLTSSKAIAMRHVKVALSLVALTLSAMLAEAACQASISGSGSVTGSITKPSYTSYSQYSFPTFSANPPAGFYVTSTGMLNAKEVVNGSLTSHSGQTDR